MRAIDKMLKTIGCLVLAILMIGNNQIAYANSIENNKEIQSIEDTYSYLETLDTLQKEYSNNKYNYSNILKYLRADRYNSKQWEILAGSIDTKFNTYVDEYKQQDLSKLKKIDTLETPYGTVDFIHMIASIDMVTQGRDVIGTWGGDLIEIASRYKDNFDTIKNIDDELKQSISKKDLADINADIDAVNIGHMLIDNKNTDKSLADTIKEYYNNSSKVNKYELFLTNTIKQTDVANRVGIDSSYGKAVKALLKRRINSDGLIKQLIKEKELDSVKYNSLIDECTDAFAEYILENTDKPAHEFESIQSKEENKTNDKEAKAVEETENSTNIDEETANKNWFTDLIVNIANWFRIII